MIETVPTKKLLAQIVGHAKLLTGIYKMDRSRRKRKFVILYILFIPV